MKIDYKLLHILSESARTNLRYISNKLKKSPQRIKYSYGVLEKENIITNPYCIIDYSHFGLILFRVYFKGVYFSNKDKSKIIDELKNSKYVVSINELTGEYDLAVEFACPNPSRFNKELKRVTNLAPTLNDYKIILNLVTHLYPKSYLPGCEGLTLYPESIIGGDRELEIFTPPELDVLKNIVLNPKIRYTSLAKSTKMNIKTIRKIFNDLEKRKIIRGFKYVLNLDKLNIFKNRLFIKLHNLTPEREQELMKFMLNNKEIIQMNKTVGDWDIEIDIESFDSNKIRYIILKLKEEFRELIERFNLIEMNSVHYISYLPEFVFE